MNNCLVGSDVQDWQNKMYQKYLFNSYFYLSLENSDHCTDYVTEKFYFALNSTAVPIAFGLVPFFSKRICDNYVTHVFKKI
jgi:hypothetical protein